MTDILTPEVTPHLGFIKLEKQLTWEQLGEEYGVTGDVVESRWKRYIKNHPHIRDQYEAAKEVKLNIEDSVDGYKDKLNYRISIQENDQEALEYLEDLVIDADQEDQQGYVSDWDAWTKGQDSLPDVFRVAFVTDIHVPYEDMRAINLHCQILEQFKPHVIPHLSDAFDLPTAGRFDYDAKMANDDILIDHTERPYNRVMRELRSAYMTSWEHKGATFTTLEPSIPGNHDIRFYNYLNKLPNVRKTVVRQFVDLIRRNGGLWLGLKSRELRLGHPANPVSVIHGMSTAKFAAEVHLNAWRGDVIAGHTHRAQFATFTSPRGVNHSHIIGCSCSLTPHYKDFKQQWQHGIGLITIDRINGRNYFENIVYNADYSAVWGGQYFKAEQKVYK